MLIEHENGSAKLTQIHQKSKACGYSTTFQIINNDKTIRTGKYTNAHDTAIMHSLANSYNFAFAVGLCPTLSVHKFNTSI